MQHQVEDMRRAAKAYRLCLAFENLCKEREPRMRKSKRLILAQNMEMPFWDELAKRAGVPYPSPATVSSVIGILRVRAEG